MRVLVAGASGFIGSATVRAILAAGHSVVALSRTPDRTTWPSGVEAIAWDARSAPAVAGPVDAVVHLAGESVAARWTEARKAEFRSSRVGIADHLVEWVAAQPAGQRPKVYVGASAVGFYGLAPKGTQREDAVPGTDFLAGLVRDWEDAAHHAEVLGVRVVLLRLGVVLHPAGGALKQMLPPFRLGVGGPVGSGTQPFPWVHREDVAGAVVWALGELKERGPSGPYNIVAPQETDMAGFAKSLAATLHRPAFFRVPGAALRLLFGRGAAEVLLGGQRAPPDKVIRDGFRFKHPDLSPALQDLLRK